MVLQQQKFKLIKHFQPFIVNDENRYFMNEILQKNPSSDPLQDECGEKKVPGRVYVDSKRPSL